MSARSLFRASVALLLLAPVACDRGRDRDDAKRAGAEKEAHNLDETGQALQARLSAPPSDLDPEDTGRARRWKSLAAFYQANGYRRVWFDEGGPRPAVAAFQSVVANAAAEGLNPIHYQVAAPALEVPRSSNPFRSQRVEPGALAEAEVRLGYAFFKYAEHVRRGRVDPTTVPRHWFEAEGRDDLGSVLQKAAEGSQLPEVLHGLAPKHPQYEALKQTLARYREIAAAGGWPKLPPKLTLRPGKTDPQVALLRARLAATGDLPAAAAAVESAPAAVFDAEVREGLKRFERRHGLKDDGLLDRETLRALNLPLVERVRQLELNLERWRWLPDNLGDRYILVNVPTFELTAFDHGQPSLAMRVVTGKEESPTPIFHDEMTTVVFSPYWNVPPDIAREETIPAVMNDPGYLSRNNLEVMRGSRVVDPWGVDWSDPRIRIRQRPGPKNSLGHVKFMFPNKFDVYLHDTPADSLFSSLDRGYSHGCIRVEKPFELAQWVLRDNPRWMPEKIQAAMNSGEEQHVALNVKIPVYIVYKTAWVDPDGTVQFRDDIYGHDLRQERVLPPSPTPAGVRVAAQD